MGFSKSGRHWIHPEFNLEVVAKVKSWKGLKVTMSSPVIVFLPIKFETINEGPCIQMLHLGSYDDEPESFKIMEDMAFL